MVPLGRGKIESVQSRHWLLRNPLSRTGGLLRAPDPVSVLITCCAGAMSCLSPLAKIAKLLFDRATGRPIRGEGLAARSSDARARAATPSWEYDARRSTETARGLS